MVLIEDFSEIKPYLADIKEVKEAWSKEEERRDLEKLMWINKIVYKPAEKDLFLSPYAAELALDITNKEWRRYSRRGIHAKREVVEFFLKNLKQEYNRTKPKNLQIRKILRLAPKCRKAVVNMNLFDEDILTIANNLQSINESYTLSSKKKKIKIRDQLKIYVPEFQKIMKTFWETRTPYIESTQKLANTCLRLVVKKAIDFKNYKETKLSLLELIQEGNIGLMRASTKYNHNRGTKFSTYATEWIDQAIRRFIYNNPKELKSLESMMDEEGFELEDLPFEEAENTQKFKELKNILDYLIEEFPERERKLMLRLWNDKYMKEEKITLRKVAEELGLCHERARQIEIKCRKRITERLRKATN